MDITSFIASHRNDALLLGDYNAYRAQLSRRLLTLRRKLGRASPKGRKYTPKAPVTAQDVASNHEYVFSKYYILKPLIQKPDSFTYYYFPQSELGHMPCT